MSRKLLVCLAGIAYCFIAGAQQNSKEAYLNWRFNTLKDQQTNSIPPGALTKAYNDAKAGSKSRSASSVNLSWNEMGPDNVGGCTPSILIDKNNSNKIFAGSAGGGLWISNDGGISWNPYDDQMADMAIASMCQSKNGDIYLGTGFGFYINLGTGAGGFVGKGVWKSTDNGITFTQLPSTIPSPNNPNVNWADVNRMAASPINNNYIGAATNRGIRISKDGGITWYNPVRANVTGQQLTGEGQDIKILSDGTCFAVIGGEVYRSSNGADSTFILLSTGAANMLPAGGITRTGLAVSPDDENFIYAAVVNNAGSLRAVYQSEDKGSTWYNIGNGSQTFDPMGYGLYAIGIYSMDLAVYPGDKYHLLLGGWSLWDWVQTSFLPNVPFGQWTQKDIPSSFNNGPSSLYPYKHIIRFVPNSNTVYFGTDGGVFRSNDGAQTFAPMNKGYNVTQCYSVAYSNMGNNILLGTQNTGSLRIKPNSSFPKHATRCGWYSDGMGSEISIINPNAFFLSKYYGIVERSANNGVTWNGCFNNRINGIYNSYSSTYGIGFAGFLSPITLWESVAHSPSVDSVTFSNPSFGNSLGVGNGSQNSFSGTLSSNQVFAKIKPMTLKITNGNQTLTDDGNGNLTGDGTGSINYTTRIYSIVFNAPPAAYSPIFATFNTYFNQGDTIKLLSNTGHFPFLYIAPALIDTGAILRIEDPISSRLYAGFTGNNGIWMTKQGLNFSIQGPEWIKIAGSLSAPSACAGESQVLTASADGSHLYVGTAEGNIYRISGLNQVKDSINGDVEVMQGNNIVQNPNCVLTCTRIGVNSNRAVTSIAVDPNDANRIVVTFGNYGNTSYVYFCNNATTAGLSFSMSNFTIKNSNLPAMPVYSSLVEMSNPNTVIIGTEYGVWATDDITQSSPVWTYQSSTASNAPVFNIRQQWHKTWLNYGWGDIYMATHGRGVWRSNTFSVTPTGIGDISSSTRSKGSLNIFPNPSNGEFIVAGLPDGKTELLIFDMLGKQVYSEQLINANSHSLQLNLNAGLYFVQAVSAKGALSGKMVITK